VLVPAELGFASKSELFVVHSQYHPAVAGGCGAVSRFLGFKRKSDFSVQPLCSLCLCGCFYEQFLNHRGTENTEGAQRRSSIGLFGRSGFNLLLFSQRLEKCLAVWIEEVFAAVGPGCF